MISEIARLLPGRPGTSPRPAASAVEAIRRLVRGAHPRQREAVPADRLSLRRLPHRAMLFAGLAAVVVAAGLVIYLERRAAAEERVRTEVIVRQVCERSASAVATRLRELFGAAVLGTVEAISHTELREYNLTRIDDLLAAGMRQHRYVDRFFFWHERMPMRASNELLFYHQADEPRSSQVPMPGPERRGGFYSDRARSGALWQAGQRLMAHRRSFAVEELVLDGVRHQAVYHFLWASPRRNSVFGIIGFIVSLDELHTLGFAQLAEASLEPLLNPADAGTRLALRVHNDAGRPVYGGGEPASGPSASEPFDLLFFPRRELGTYLASASAVAQWHLTVSPAQPLPQGRTTSLWLLAAVVLLLSVAVACAISVNREAIRVSRLQSDFVLNVSHQLRTPLAMLSGAAETLGLERIRSPEKVKEYSGIVGAQARRLSALVDQILHFHRIEHTRDAADWQPVDLGEIVAHSAEEVRSLADHAAVRVRVRRRRPGPIVLGDAAALEHAVVNLIENAVKYGRGDGEVVTVLVREWRGRAVITVRDRGIGIGPADLPHIFRTFYRGRGEGATRRGFGLGLAIVRTTVEIHGGRIGVQSQPGRGSAFTLSLPVAG